MPLQSESSQTATFASIRRSERLAQKAALFEQSLEGETPAVDFDQTSVEMDDYASFDRMKSPRAFTRRSVRQSIRRSLQPFANILSSGKKRKDATQPSSNSTEEGDIRRPKTAIYQNPIDIMNERFEKRRSRNTLCLSTISIDVDTRTHEFRVPAPPRPQPKSLDLLKPEPMPRKSLVRLGNVPPPLPPPRKPCRTEKPDDTDEMRQLEALDPKKVFRTLREISVNSPKRKMPIETDKTCNAIDENSPFVTWTDSSTNVEKKRRKTTRLQTSSLNLLKVASNASSGKSKLQLSLYVNHGHLSVHVIRAANLPLLPDQHDLNTYVKIAVEPKECHTAQHRSELIPSTVDPLYDFRLSFELPADLREQDRSLLITIWHRDVETKQSRLLGFLNFSMKKVIEVSRIDGWFRLPSLAITKRTQI